MQQQPRNPDIRPLPQGWCQYFDTRKEIWYYVQIDVSPARVVYTHPADFQLQYSQRLNRSSLPAPVAETYGSSFAHQLYADCVATTAGPSPAVHHESTVPNTYNFGWPAANSVEDRTPPSIPSPHIFRSHSCSSKPTQNNFQDMSNLYPQVVSPQSSVGFSRTGFVAHRSPSILLNNSRAQPYSETGKTGGPKFPNCTIQSKYLPDDKPWSVPIIRTTALAPKSTPNTGSNFSNAHFGSGPITVGFPSPQSSATATPLPMQQKRQTMDPNLTVPPLSTQLMIQVPPIGQPELFSPNRHSTIQNGSTFSPTSPPSVVQTSQLNQLSPLSPTSPQSTSSGSSSKTSTKVLKAVGKVAGMTALKIAGGALSSVSGVPSGVFEGVGKAVGKALVKSDLASKLANNLSGSQSKVDQAQLQAVIQGKPDADYQAIIDALLVLQQQRPSQARQHQGAAPDYQALIAELQIVQSLVRAQQQVAQNAASLPQQIQDHQPVNGQVKMQQQQSVAYINYPVQQFIQLPTANIHQSSPCV